MQVGDRVIVWYGLQYLCLISVVDYFVSVTIVYGIVVGLLVHIGVASTTMVDLVYKDGDGVSGLGMGLVSVWFATNISVGLLLTVGAGSLSTFQQTVLTGAYCYSCVDACCTTLLAVWAADVPLPFTDDGSDLV